MPKHSAGILLYRLKPQLQVLLVHPGGPFWAKKDLGAWSIPKGEYEVDEDPLHAACREFEEETGVKLTGQFFQLAPVKLKSGKLVTAFITEGDLDVLQIVSNSFEMEWPPRSGKKQSFPEIDRGEWFSIEAAKEKINEAMAALLDQLVELKG